ncbi:hypothetical protein C1646_774409 [Rhizophagus diaphanus]|nr:hypothetical protein C1646_774409 [Rhizophagus diaphanus] [Rhizophagus sp. MUCL 43196]
MISNEEILKEVLPNNNNNQEKEAEDSDPLPPITHNEAIDYYDKLKKEALKQRFFSARQTDLNSFINII